MVVILFHRIMTRTDDSTTCSIPDRKSSSSGDDGRTSRNHTARPQKWRRYDMSAPPPPLNEANLLSALRVLSCGVGAAAAGAATDIKEAERALLAWEQVAPDAYALGLLSVMQLEQIPQQQMAAVPRLAAALSLKACIGRKWKDRGRGRARPLPRRGDEQDGQQTQPVPPAFLSDATKDAVRFSILSIVAGVTIHPATNGQELYMPTLSRALASLLSSDPSIQSACTSLLARIGRFDLPMTFHELIPTLISSACGASAIQTKCNALQALDAVLAEICDKRLLLDKKFVVKIVTEHIATLVQQGYIPAMDDGVVGVMQSSNEQETTVIENRKMVMQYATTMASVLRRLLRHSLPSALNPPCVASVDHLFTSVIKFVPALLGVVRNGERSNHQQDVDSLLEELCHLTIDVQKAHPIEFGRYLAPFLELFHQQLVDIASSATPASGDILEEDSSLGRFVMASMAFLSNVLGCRKYEPDEQANASITDIREGTSVGADGMTKRTITATGDAFATSSTLNAIEHAVQTVWVYFTPERMTQLADLAIRKLMVLSNSRLEEWEADSEGYFHAESSRSSEDDVNVCAQALYLSLVESKVGKAVVAPRIVEMLQDLESQASAARIEASGNIGSSGTGGNDVLILDAIYTAAGISLNALEDGAGFSFGAFFDTYLLPCLEMLLRDQTPNSTKLPILRQRIVWLIAANTFSVPETSRSRLYQAILTMIVAAESRQNDKMVKLTAAQVLNNSLFDRDESLIIFKDHSDSIINALYVLASGCEEYDSKSLVLSCVSFVLTYLIGCGTMNEATANAAVGPLTQIWSEAVDQNSLLRRDVLSILSCIAQAVGSEQSVHLHPIALPMLDAALEPAQREDNLFLTDDTLALWLSLLRLSPAYSEALGSLFPRVQSLLEEDLEHVKVLMMIAETYILLGGAVFLNAHSTPLQVVLGLVVGNVHPRGAAYVMLVLEALMRAFPAEGGQLLLQANILRTMLDSCAAFYSEDRGSEPERVVSLYLTVFARALLSSPRLMDGNLSSTLVDDAAFGPNELIQLYFRLFDYGIASGGFDKTRRKLWVLMSLSLLPPTESLYGVVVVDHISKGLAMYTSVNSEEAADNSFGPYEVGQDDEEESFLAGEENYKALLAKQCAQDIVLTANLHQAFSSALEGLKRCYAPGSREADSLAQALADFKL